MGFCAATGVEDVCFIRSPVPVAILFMASEAMLRVDECVQALATDWHASIAEYLILQSRHFIPMANKRRSKETRSAWEKSYRSTLLRIQHRCMLRLTGGERFRSRVDKIVR